MAGYQKTQHSKILIVAVAIAVLITALAMLLALPIIDLWIFALVIAAAGLCIAVAWQFSSLTVEVENDALRWWFGRGFWRKSALLADITSAEPVRNRWWWGWGIRYYGKGWLYNISGLDAVEIILKSGKHIRIGTEDPNGLAKALDDTRAASR